MSPQFTVKSRPKITPLALNSFSYSALCGEMNISSSRTFQFFFVPASADSDGRSIFFCRVANSVG